MGVGITVEHLNAFYGKNQALFDVNITVLANHATRAHRPFGLRENHVHSLSKSLARTIPEAAGRRAKVNIGDLIVYKRNLGHPTAPPRGHGVQKPNPFPTMSIYDNVAAGLKLNGFSNRKQLDEVVENSLNSAALWDEVKGRSPQAVRREPVRRAATTSVHRPRSRRPTGSSAHG